MLVSSEFGEPNAYEPGFDIEDVGAGRYGQRLHFWNLAERRLEQTVDLGEAGLVPLEVRWLHDPEAEQGFVGATLASNILRFHRPNGGYQAERVIEVDNGELEGWPLPGGVPGLITDIVLSMDDRFLYLSNWLHGDLRQYDVSDPANPRLTGRLWLGGLLGKPSDAGRELSGGPQMIQLSLDGRRLYVTNSLYSTWDNQFYPGLRSWMLQVNCVPGRRNGGRPGLLRRLPRPARRPRASPRGAPAGRRLHDGDLPVISVPFAHVGGIPVEETVGAFGPALLMALGVASAKLRVRLGGNARSSRRRTPPCKKAARMQADRLNRNETAIIKAAPLDAAELRRRADRQVARRSLGDEGGTTRSRSRRRTQLGAPRRERGV